jgi:hypothetical protein
MTNQSRTEFPNLPGRFTGTLGGSTPEMMESFSKKDTLDSKKNHQISHVLLVFACCFPYVSHSLLIEVPSDPSGCCFQHPIWS